MKKNILFLFFSLSVSLVFGFGVAESSKELVTVYAYDSFTAEWGPGPELKRRFEEETGYTLQYVTFDDAPAVLSQAVIEGENCRADVLVGIDNFNFRQAKDSGVLQAYKSKNVSRISPKELIFDSSFLVTPYDYGYFAFMYDIHSKYPAPKTLADLTKKEYARSVVIMDPRTSTPGTGLLMWTYAVYGDGDDFLNFWKKLKPSILTMTPGWTAGYGLFTNGEAPLALSYTTSEAYHRRYDNTDRYRALVFPEGHIKQVECLALTKVAPNKEGGKAFIDFMLSEKAQEVIPENQWMYPVAMDAPLPASFTSVKLPEKNLQIMQAPQNLESLIDRVIDILK
ncbi:MAG: thiamine ABC transporter substrate binding subunit [Treponemataceae bacterium]